MRGKSPMKVAVAATAIALFATGCQSSGETPAASDGGNLRVYAAEPAGLLPGNNDSPSITIVRQLFSGLVDFDAKTGAVKMNIAESIESTDNTTWTIKLKKGHTFENGEAVNADSFINAWNWVAYGPNAQPNSYFMSHIVGYADTQSGKDPDGDGPQKGAEPKSKSMSGLKKVDDSTFTVTLDKAFVGLPQMVGYAGFYPMAAACLADTKACNEKPIGNGRYKMDGAWKHNVEVKVVRSDSFKGDKGKSASIQFKIYDKIGTGFADFQAGELDVQETLPPEKYQEAVAAYKDTLFEQPSNTFTYVGVPLYDKRFENVKVRQAISMAIDRQAIIDKIFFGRFSAAEGVVSPNFEGARKGVCTNCKYDPAKAKALLAEAGGWTGGKLVLWANAGAGHDAWLAAVGDQLKANLGIDYELNVGLQFAQYLQTADDKKFTGLFRLGWNPDYNVAETYLAPLYGTDGSSNNSGYSNKEFDDLVSKGNAAKTIAEANKFYAQAEDIIVRDLPVIPMWFGKTSVVYAKTVQGGMPYNTIQGVEYHNIQVK